MKIVVSLLYSATLAGAMLTASAQNTPVINAPIAIKDVQSMSAGEKQLLETASKANFNVLVDSTDVSPMLPISQVTSGKTPTDILVMQAQDFHFSALPFDSTSFLFWNEPDSQVIAQSIAQGQGYGPEAGMLPLDKIAESIDTFLKNRAEHNEDEDTGVYNFKLAELPDGLQQQLAAHFFQIAMQEASPNFSVLWLNDAPWQNANIYYVPANPRFMGSMQSLVAVSRIASNDGSQELRLNLMDGFASATLEPEPKKDGQLKADELRVLPLISNQDKSKSAIVINSPRKAGSAIAEVASSIILPLSQDDPKLATPVSISAVRLTLDALITRIATQTKTNLSISPEVGAKRYTVSATISSMALNDAMSAVARLYDLSWKRGTNDSYRLEPTAHSEFQTTLHRVGDFSWYRFREDSASAYKAYTAAFDELAARVVDEAGPNILEYPGVPYSSLSAETQQSLRDSLKNRLARNILFKQVSVLPLLEGEWSFIYKPKPGSLTLKIGEKPTQTLSFPIRVQTWQPAF